MPTYKGKNRGIWVGSHEESDTHRARVIRPGWLSGDSSGFGLISNGFGLVSIDGDVSVL